MKRVWGDPKIVLQMFVPQEYCDTCYAFHADLTCAIPGSSNSSIGDGNSARNDSNGLSHGICGNQGYADFTGLISAARGMETSTDPNAPAHEIYNMAIGTKINATTTTGFSSNIGNPPATFDVGYYRASWRSNDDNGNVYMHYGLAHVTRVQIRPGGPNAS